MSFKTFIAAVGVVAMASVGTAHANNAARFELANISGQNIDIIQVSPVSSGNWGHDLLGEDRMLPAGDVVVVTPGAPGCMFDVRVTYHDREQESFRNVNLCRTTRISFANTQDYTVS